MGAFSFTDQELANEVIADARSAWDAGYRHFVHEVRAGVGLKNDFGRLLTLTVEGVADIGWRLHSLTPYVNTIATNNREAVVTFERPG